MAEEMKLEIAENKLSMPRLTKPVEGIEQEVEHRAIFHILGGKGIDKLGEIQGAADAPQVTAKGQKAIDGLTLGHDVQVSSPGEHQRAVSQELDMPAQLARWLAHPLGYGSYFAQI